MGFGGFYKGEKKKPKKSDLEKRAQKTTSGGVNIPPAVEIIGRGKKNTW